MLMDLLPASALPSQGCNTGSNPVELLVYSTRSAPVRPFSLVFPIRDLFLQMTPELRKRAAARAFLLVDFEFTNLEWWTAVRQFPEKQFRGTAWRNSFPWRSAIPLTRAALMLAWQVTRMDAESACVLLGITEEVANIIESLQLTELDRIADRRHRHLEPRWADRPTMWRLMLSEALAPNPAAMKRIDAYGLQLLTVNLTRATTGERPTDVSHSRVSPHRET
jgi:hypothetical protein